MAAASGRESAHLAGLAARLLSEAHRFDFFQAVRLLVRRARKNATAGEERGPVGEDLHPSREAVRFGAHNSLSFPPSEIAELRRRAGRNGKPAAPDLEMAVSFLGLTGPAGVLPQHYTRLILERLRAKDTALADFLDLFNHRLISFFFRAWEKYRFPTAWERARLEAGRGEDLFTSCLYSLIGLGTGGLREKLPDHGALPFYAGILADRRRPAASLEGLLSDHFGFPAQVLQFQGRWLELAPEDLSSLPGRGRPGANNVLGSSAVLGGRVWDVRSKFRVKVGPLGLAEYLGLLPGGETLRSMSRIVRFSVGAEQDFDVQPVLRAKEIPALQLGGAAAAADAASAPGAEGAPGAAAPRLGWTTWLLSRPAAQDFSGASFAAEER